MKTDPEDVINVYLKKQQWNYSYILPKKVYKVDPRIFFSITDFPLFV